MYMSTPKMSSEELDSIKMDTYTHIDRTISYVFYLVILTRVIGYS